MKEIEIMSHAVVFVLVGLLWIYHVDSIANHKFSVLRSRFLLFFSSMLLYLLWMDLDYIYWNQSEIAPLQI